jgi:hypothetical protein
MQQVEWFILSLMGIDDYHISSARMGNCEKFKYKATLNPSS